MYCDLIAIDNDYLKDPNLDNLEEERVGSD